MAVTAVPVHVSGYRGAAVAAPDFVDVESWDLREAAPQGVASHHEVEIERDEQTHEFGQGAVVDLGERVIAEDDAQRPAIVAEAGEVAVSSGEQGHVGDEADLSLGELGAPGQATLLVYFRSEDGDGDLVPLAVVQGGGEVDGVPATRIGAVVLLHSLAQQIGEFSVLGFGPNHVRGGHQCEDSAEDGVVVAKAPAEAHADTVAGADLAEA